MKDFVALLKNLENTSSRNEKLALLRRVNTPTLEIIRWALDPYRTFKIQSIVKLPTTLIGRRLDNEAREELISLLSQLAAAPAINNALRGSVHDHLAGYSDDDRAYIRRVFLKDLRCGVDVSTVNFAHPGAIPAFDLQLAAKLDGDKIKLQDIPLPVYVDHKYNGYRCITFVDTANKTVQYLSKEGRELPAYAGLFDEDLFALCRLLLPAESVVMFDGEMMAGSYQQVAQSRGKKGDRSSNHYRVFWYMPATLWHSCTPGPTTTEVYEKLGEAVVKHLPNLRKDLKVVFTQTELCHTHGEIETAFNRAIEDGLEGVVIKQPDQPYVFKRSRAWIKWKPEFDATGYAVEFLPGEPGKGYEHTLGSILVEGELENGEKFKASCIGFTDAQRAAIWAVRKELVNEPVEINYGEKKLKVDSKDGVYGLWFPIFDAKKSFGGRFAKVK